MPTVPSEFVTDWRELLDRYGGELNPDPSAALPGETFDEICEAYDKSRAAGFERAREAYRNRLRHRVEVLKEKASDIAADSGRAELEHAEERRPPLQSGAERKATDFGRNLDVLYEALGTSYKAFAAVTGISQSTLYKITNRKTVPSLASVMKVSISLGVAPSVLLAGYPELEGWEEAARLRPLPAEVQELRLEETTGRMERRLRGEEDDELFDPACWLELVEESMRAVTARFQSPGGALGAAIGRHHGGEKGAWVAGLVGHRLRAAAEREDLGGFRFPGSYVRACLRERLGDRFWE